MANICGSLGTIGSKRLIPHSGKVMATIPAPAHGRDSGLTWAEGTLWVGEYRARKIHQIDANTGAILRTIESDRFVTGVSWANDELWHGTLEDGQSEIRRVNPETGEVLERLAMPDGITVSGLETDGAGVYLLRWDHQWQGARGAEARKPDPDGPTAGGSREFVRNHPNKQPSNQPT